MRVFARRVSARDFSKRILIDSLITDFVQLACGSFSSSVVRVLQMWFVFFGLARASRVSRVFFVWDWIYCLFIRHAPICDCQFKCEYTRVRARVLVSSSASTRECSHSQFNTRVCFTFTRVSRTRSFAILVCNFACHASRSNSFVNLRLSGTVSQTISCMIANLQLLLNIKHNALSFLEVACTNDILSF